MLNFFIEIVIYRVQAIVCLQAKLIRTGDTNVTR